MKRTTPILAALVLAVGVVATAPSASAATASCSTLSGHLNLSVSTANYYNGRSITAHATGSYKQVNWGGRDITWKITKLSASGLQNRYGVSSTTWGASSGNRVPYGARNVAATWTGYLSMGGRLMGTHSCTKGI